MRPVTAVTTFSSFLVGVIDTVPATSGRISLELRDARAIHRIERREAQELVIAGTVDQGERGLPLLRQIGRPYLPMALAHGRDRLGIGLRLDVEQRENPHRLIPAFDPDEVEFGERLPWHLRCGRLADDQIDAVGLAGAL